MKPIALSIGVLLAWGGATWAADRQVAPAGFVKVVRDRGAGRKTSWNRGDSALGRLCADRQSRGR